MAYIVATRVFSFKFGKIVQQIVLKFLCPKSVEQILTVSILLVMNSRDDGAGDRDLNREHVSIRKG